MTNNFFENYFDNYLRGQYSEIFFKKKEYEKRLNDMWGNYLSGNPSQILSYNKQLLIIKKSGYKVFRNSRGEHKIVIGK